MDTDRLRYFVTVAKLGSLARAAEVLRLSAPALSKAMTTLERELGRELFVRSGRQLVLSDDGQALLQKAEDVVRRLDELRAPAGAERPATLRIASFEVFTTHLIGPLARELLAKGRDLELHEAVPGEIERAVVQRRVDYGLTYVPIPTQGVDFLRVAAVDMGVYGRAGAFAGKALEELPFAVPLSPLTGVPTRARGLDGWPDDRITRLTPYRVTLMESALELCRQGLAVAFLPRFVVRLHNAKVEARWRLQPAAPNPPGVGRSHVWLIKRQAASEGAEARSLARAVRLLCKDKDRDKDG